MAEPHPRVTVLYPPEKNGTHKPEQNGAHQSDQDDAAPSSPGPPGPPRLRGRLGRVLPAVTHNWLSLAGLMLAMCAGVVLVITLILRPPGGGVNPYADTVIFLFVPAILVLGLVLVPAGALLDLRLRRRRPVEFNAYPVLDLNLPKHRTMVLGFAVATAVVVTLLGVATTRAVSYMDTPEFCGSCHGVMAPEAAAYQGSPHARVDCVDCHIGPGAEWYVRSKMSGLRQVVNYSLGTYPRPIPAPISNLRPAQDTCEQCHWPEKFFGDTAVVRPHFAPDEANSGTATTFVVRTGGGSPTGSSSTGIHWHMNIRNEVRYVAADRERQQIPWVEVTDPSGVKTVYEDKSAFLSPAALISGEKRLMDCMDCHNRPTHIFQSPNAIMDGLLDAGEVDRSLPFVKREAVAVLSQSYPDQATAQTSIAQRLEDFYRDGYPAVYGAQRGNINRAVSAIQSAYARNFFPEMKVDWRTYPDNIGHQEKAGCFRCHDGKHVSSAGAVIPNACDTCHSMPSTTSLPAGAPVAGRLSFTAAAPIIPAAVAGQAASAAGGAAGGPPAPAPAATAPPAAGQAPPSQPAAPTPAAGAGGPAQVPVAPSPTTAAAPTAPAAAIAPAVPPVPPVPPAAPAGEVVLAPKLIPHTTVGRETCLMCHGAGSLAVPVSHAGRADATCTGCHKAA